MLSSATKPPPAKRLRRDTSSYISGHKVAPHRERMEAKTSKTYTPTRQSLGVKAVVVMVVMLLLAGGGSGSELPDRECCDSAPPPPPHYHTVTSTTTSTTPQPPAYGGSQQQEHQTLNCLLAKQLCEEDSNCSAILKVIPTLCGPELVACSTVTVSRCQAALKTLVQFSWFQPTCLCKEPRLDPQCNAFRDLLFDHPCVFVSRKEVDLHPLQYIPTCHVASDSCRESPWCQQRLDVFHSTCKYRDGRCRNPDREGCLKAWLQLRETPLLGCICPDSKDKRCSHLYSLVNENPCLGERYPGRVAAMSRVAAALGSPLSQTVPVPTAAATHLIISTSQADPLYPLSTIHHYLQHLPVTKADQNVSMEQLKYVAGTCHEAFEGCMANSGCRSHLEVVSGYCEAAKCDVDACRGSIKNIYKYLLDNDQELALKIALCVCRDSNAKNYGKCLRGQRRLHPPCALMSDSASASQCHSLGKGCRGDRVCRYQLEHYELSCAADTVTGRCAGHHRECTKAMLGLLGTNLHTNCVCKVNAFQDINQCLAWKRLIWGNPCVVEAQLTYHLGQLGLNTDPLISSFTGRHDAHLDRFPAEEETPSSQMAVVGGANRALYSRYDSREGLTEESPRPVGVEARKVASTAQSDHTHPNAAPAEPSTTFTTTTATGITTTKPEKFCSVKIHGESTTHIIAVGDKKRLYEKKISDCSTLCSCNRHHDATCQVLGCMKEKACETTIGENNNNSPAYQVTRGDCICYAGDIVCQRPKEEDFHLPMGVFLMLGYSRNEEALLKNVTNSGVAEAIPSLQQLFRSIANNLGEDCQLELLYHTQDNVVLQARHSRILLQSMNKANTTYSQDMLQEERDRCEEAIHRVGAMFQHRAERIHHDAHLSLFVMAEVIDNVPDHQRHSNGQALRASWWAWLTGLAVVLVAMSQASCFSIAAAEAAS